MSSAVQIWVHPSQFPDRVRRDLLQSLRTRQINHKFLYDGVKQTQKWLALHQAYSPSRNDPDCAATYEKSFREATARVTANHVHLVGLGCGGGQKDTQMLRLLHQVGKRVSYTPADVSTAMVLVARQTALVALPEIECSPLVLDLASSDDLSALLEGIATPEQARLITFFGMIPNFLPQQIMPALAGLVRPGDLLLFSANLAPGPDYSAGVAQILPLYDNELTREWLMGFLLDLGVQKSDGQLRFIIEEEPPGSGLQRVAAYFEFQAARELQVEEETFSFQPGERIRLFFSYRHTPTLVARVLQQHRFRVVGEWITKSEEEGVFLAVKTPPSSAAPP
jgi:L-histidine Nalpha-methyltransferase